MKWILWEVEFCHGKFRIRTRTMKPYPTFFIPELITNAPTSRTLQKKRNLGHFSSRSGLWGRYKEQNKIRVASSRLSVSDDDRKSGRAKSGISCVRDPRVKRRGRPLFPYQTPLFARPLFQSSTLTESV